MKKYRDLTGIKFNNIEVIGEDIERNEIQQQRVKNKEIKYFRRFWVCKCSCGNKFSILDTVILEKSQKGCMECCSKRRATPIKSNRYDLSGEYGIGYLKDNEPFYFDLEDYDLIKDIYWNKTNAGYIRGYKNKKQKWIHRMVINKNENEVIDHINRNRLDNRKENLRVCTQQENTFNSKLSKNNTSGIIGVYLRKDTNSWSSNLMFNREKISLGCYNTKEDAIIARLNGEIKYFGKDFAPQRHLFNKYNLDKKIESLTDKISVFCIETNMKYNSLTECGNLLNLSTRLIKKSADSNGKYGTKGYHFKYIK